MSEQSPWGSPPPSDPFGQPTQQPHQTQPPVQPPVQQFASGGGAYDGPPYGGSPYGQGPQQPRRRTGLIIAISVAVVLVAAAFAVTLVVASGDDEPGEASSTAANPTGSTDPTEPTDSADGTETGSGTPSDPATGDTVEGEGYTFDLPADGWTDASDEAGQLGGGPTIDTVVVLGESIQLAQSNIIVEALSAGGASEPEDLEGQWKRNLSGGDGATPVDVDDATLDGERAIGVRIDDRVNEAGVPIKQVAYLALHDGRQYSIGLSFPAEGDIVSEDDFQALLDSWRWAS